MIDRHLSIWEIAHRWHDVNPDMIQPVDIPIHVQDTIRYICCGILDGEIALLEFVVIKPVEQNGNVSSRSKLQPFWISTPPPEIEKALYREYDKDTLNSFFVECENLFDYCLHEQSQRNGFGGNLDYPKCWWPFISTGSLSVEEIGNPEIPQAQPAASTLRPSTVHKLTCQAIAKTLWDIHPKMTITAMTEHKAILEYGGGKHYIGKNTLRDWLSEIAPENIKKPGRPKSRKPNNDAA